MEPITTALIAASLLKGFAYLDEQLAGKTLLNPLLDPVAEKLRAWLPRLQRQEERQIVDAVQQVFYAVGAPQQADNLHEFILTTGFDQFAAQGNHTLRHETARTVLVMTAPDVMLIPEAIFQWVRWPNSQRPLLAHFLYEVRRNLAGLETMRPLIEYADRDDVRQRLRALQLDLSRTADAAERRARYLQALLLDRGLAADKPDGQALGEYKETADGGRVVRGGSWGYYFVFARCAIRDGLDPDLSNVNVGCWVVVPIGSDFGSDC